MKDKRMTEELRLVANFNYWQSLKWQGKFEEIEAEVAEADFSAKQLKFKLGQAALLDQEERFFELLPQVLESSEITRADLFGWPLFRAIRSSERFRLEYGTQVEEESEAGLASG